MVAWYKVTFMVDGKAVYTEKLELGLIEVKLLEQEIGAVVERI